MTIKDYNCVNLLIAPKISAELHGSISLYSEIEKKNGQPNPVKLFIFWKRTIVMAATMISINKQQQK